MYIFLTNNIDRRKRALATGRPLYDFISEQTGGQVVVVRKEDVSAATELLKATTVQGQVCAFIKKENYTLALFFLFLYYL